MEGLRNLTKQTVYCITVYCCHLKFTLSFCLHLECVAGAEVVVCDIWQLIFFLLPFLFKQKLSTK